MLKLCWAIRVTFCPGQAGQIKYPGLIQILCCITCVDNGAWDQTQHDELNMLEMSVSVHASTWVCVSDADLVSTLICSNAKMCHHYCLIPFLFYRSSVLLKTEAPPPLVQEISQSSLTIKVCVF